MENVFRKKQKALTSKENISDENKTNSVGHRPPIKDLAKVYLTKISKCNQTQKVNLMYKSLIGKKPDVSLSIDQKLNRILYNDKFGKYIKHTKSFSKKKKNKFKWPAKWKKIFKTSRKKRNQILVWFLNIKGEIEPPKLYPIYFGNVVIIKNRPYEVDPRSFWRLGKYTCQIIKGIDRRPVSNLDYEEIKSRGDATDSDELLIKATLQAYLNSTHKKPVDKKTLIIIGVIVIAAVIFFLSQ